MASGFQYDDINLQRMYDELQPRRRVQALRSAFRKEAGKVRKVAIGNLRSSGLRRDRSLEKGVRSIVYRKTAGFRVTVGESGKKGYHVNRFGFSKPVLRWAEGGTAERSTKKGYKRGSMPRYGFMSRTLDSVKDSVTDDIHMFVTESVIKTAAKYGCKKG